MDDRYRSLPLNPLRAFAVASRHRTFTAAAQHMGVTQVAVSRQITLLENYLGVQLFDRSSRALKLTEAGRAFGQEIAGIFDDLERAMHRVLLQESESSIDFRTYPTFARHWLIPKLSGFAEKYPKYRVRLDTTVEPLDFRGTHLDAALQLGHGDWRDARCRRLFDEVIDVVCSPAYAERFDGFREARRIDDAVLLHAKYRRREWDMWSEATRNELSFRNHLDFDSSLLTYSAAEHGLGLAVGQLDLLRDQLAKGTLVRPFNKPVQTGLAFYVVWPTIKSVSTQTRHFIDWLLECCNEKAEYFR